MNYYILTACLFKFIKQMYRKYIFFCRKEVIEHLPHNAILNTPFTPCKTPISINPK